MTGSTYWRPVWNAKARDGSVASASGRSSYGLSQQAALLGDIWEALGLHSRSEVLDVGCGAGYVGRVLRCLVSRYVGVDYSEPLLARFRRESLGVETLCASATSIPLPDASFDAVVLSSVLLCLDPASEVPGALREARRLVRPGGRGFLGGNPDVRRQQWTLDRAHGANTTWFEREALCSLACTCGWERAEARTLSSLLPQAQYQFDVVVWA